MNRIVILIICLLAFGVLAALISRFRGGGGATTTISSMSQGLQGQGSKIPTIVGFKYGLVDNQGVNKLLAQLRDILLNAQFNSCTTLKTLWTTYKPTFIKNFASTGSTCAQSKEAALLGIRVTLGDQLPAEMIAPINAHMSALLDTLYSQTCLNDKPDVIKTVQLIDSLVEAICTATI